jgi:hypothetical protein
MICKKHPKYKAILKPRKTNLHPDGCEKCWEIYLNKKLNKSVSRGYYVVRSNEGSSPEIARQMSIEDIRNLKFGNNNE